MSGPRPGTGGVSGVLAVRQDSLGDVLLMGPAIRAIAAASDGPVTLLCGPRGEAAARLLPGVGEVLTHLAAWIDPAPPPVERAGCERLIADVAARAPAEAIIFTSFHQSPLPTALLLRLAGVRKITAISPDYPGALLDVRHAVPDDIHETERALSLAAAAGYELPAGDRGLLAVKPVPPPPGLPAEPFFVIHPGASVRARSWEPESWRRLTRELGALGNTVVVTGAPHERELTEYVCGGSTRALDFGGRCSFGELAAVLGKTEVVAVANTGPAHLAAAAGAPVVSLFAPTVPAVRWRPWGVPHRLLYKDVPCAGCRALNCPVPGHPCLNGVEIREVIEAIFELAETRRAGALWTRDDGARTEAASRTATVSGAIT